MTTTSRETSAGPGDAPEDITAVPVRHPGRWVGVAVLAVLVAMLVNGVVNNTAYHWDTVGKYVFDQRLSAAALVTLELTVLAMFFGVRARRDPGDHAALAEPGPVLGRPGSTSGSSAARRSTPSWSSGA